MFWLRYEWLEDKWFCCRHGDEAEKTASVVISRMLDDVSHAEEQLKRILMRIPDEKVKGKCHPKQKCLVSAWLVT